MAFAPDNNFSSSDQDNNQFLVDFTLKFIVWLIFSKYNFQKTISYFPDLKQDFENG